MKKANKGAVLNPCPPFYPGEEVSVDVINSDYFVGYEFKKHLLNVQQAIMIYCLTR
jgi:ornithine carbamoyltransferase